MSVDFTGSASCRYTLTAALILLGVSAAQAEDIPPPAETTTQLEAVKITAEQSDATAYAVKDSAAATKLPLTLRQTPQSVTVITRERLDDQNLQSLRDVLDNTTGVYSYAYDTERVVFTSRGFVIDNLLYDGVPAATNQSTDSIDETLDTELYERIEVIRGATGLLSGAGSPSASINLVRKHADARSLDTALGIEYGSWDNRRVTADVSTPLDRSGDVRARIIGVYQDRESFQDLYANEKKVFYGVIDADLTPKTRLSLGYDYQDYKADSNTWGSFPLFLGDGTRTDWPRSVTTATDWSYWDKRKQTAFAEIRHQFDNDWSLRSTLSYRKFNDDLALFYLEGFPDPVDGSSLAAYGYRDASDIKESALDLYASGPVEAFGRKHELVAGASVTRTKAGEDEAPDPVMPDPGNFFDWDGSYPEPDFGDLSSIRDVDFKKNALYAAARVSLADPLKLIAGARFSTIKTDYFYTYTSGDAFNHEHTKTVPYAGLVYDFSRAFSAFASYTGIFNPQNARAQDGRYLDPVEGKSLEAGLKGEHFGGRLNTALTVFRTLQDNVSTPLLDENGDNVKVVINGNETMTDASYAVDGVRTRGFELEAAGSPLPGWNLSFGWSRYLLDDADHNAVKPYIPRTLLRVFTTWTPGGALARLTIGGGVNWQSDSNLDVYAPDGPVNIRQDSVTLLSALARYEVIDGLSVQLNAGNLLDKKYYVLDEYSNLYFGTPRNGSIGIRYEF